ncbi:MAG: HD domain-containing protein [Acidimicrobiales bacterium]
MDESTAGDWESVLAADGGWEGRFQERLLRHLGLLASDRGAFAVDRLTHSLQTAHRAEMDGRDDAYLVCALLHDIGDLLTPLSHADLGAAIVRPWVPESYHWMVQHHAVFQGYYFWHHIGHDRDARDAFADHPGYGLTEEFVRLYDMPSFDPAYPTPPLEHFEPLIRAFFKEGRSVEPEAVK